MKIYDSMAACTGKTPLIRLTRYASAAGIGRAALYGKVELFNPGGSVKDRVGAAMIRAAETAGHLSAGMTIVEPTSGNTGIGIALAAALKGYRTMIVMPESMSVERRRMMTAFGAKVILTPAADGMAGAIAHAEELASRDGYVLLGQFRNPANVQCHYEETGPEIWTDTAGQVDVLVAGVGTGGTVTGVGRYLKEKNPQVRIVAVEPDASAVLSGEQAGKHRIQGIGAGFIPEILDTTVYDEVIRVTDESAAAEARRLCRTEGIFAGISSGAALAAVRALVNRPDYADKRFVVMLPDSGNRYLSTDLFDAE